MEGISPRGLPHTVSIKKIPQGLTISDSKAFVWKILMKTVTFYSNTLTFNQPILGSQQWKGIFPNTTAQGGSQLYLMFSMNKLYLSGIKKLVTPWPIVIKYHLTLIPRTKYGKLRELCKHLIYVFSKCIHKLKGKSYDIFDRLLFYQIITLVLFHNSFLFHIFYTLYDGDCGSDRNIVILTVNFI